MLSAFLDAPRPLAFRALGLGLAVAACSPSLARAGTLKGTLSFPAPREDGGGASEAKAHRALGYWRVENGVLPIAPASGEARDGVVVVLEPEGSKSAAAAPEKAAEKGHEKTPEKPMVIEAHARRFEPAIAVVAPGTPIALHNADKAARTFFLVDGERFVPRQTTAPDAVREVKFSVPGEYRLADADNGRKQAVVLVLAAAAPHAVSDDKGAFSIEAPEGRYRLRAYYRGAWAADQAVQVGKRSEVTVKLAAPEAAAAKTAAGGEAK